MNETTAASAAASSSLIRQHRPQFAIGLMVFATLNFAAMEAISKYLTADYPFAQISWGRWAFHFAFCLPFFLTPRFWPSLRTRRPVANILRPLLLVVATFSFIGALTRMELANATALVFTAPLIVTALSPLVLKEPVGLRRWLAVGVGFGGVIVILRPGAGFEGWIALLPLVAGVCYATYQLATRLMAHSESTPTMFFYVSLVGFAGTSIALPFFWESPTWAAWGWMAASGLLGLTAQWCVIKAFTLAQAATVSPFLYVQLLWATMFGFVLFGHFPDLWTVVGAAILISSGVYIWYRERRIAGRRAG